MRERVSWMALFAAIVIAFAVQGGARGSAGTAGARLQAGAALPTVALVVPPIGGVVGTQAEAMATSAEPAAAPATPAIAEPTATATSTATEPTSATVPRAAAVTFDTAVPPTATPAPAVAAPAAIAPAVSEGLLDAAIRRYERAILGGGGAEGLFARRCGAAPPAGIVRRKQEELAAEAGNAFAGAREGVPAVAHFDLLEAHAWMGFTLDGVTWRPRLPDWWVWEDGAWRNADC